MEEDQKLGFDDLELENQPQIVSGHPVCWPWQPLPAGMTQDDALALFGEVC